MSVDGDDGRNCWVCFATDEDDRQALWVQPCRCIGTTKWVHQQCLQRWIDEKQKGNHSHRVSCPQCNTEYIIIFPKFGSFVYVLDLMDRLVYRLSPFISGGLALASVYWTAVTYGAITVMQVIGQPEGLDLLESSDPVFLLVSLPTIPVMLILGKMIRWDTFLLKLWWRHASRLPEMKNLLSSLNGELPANSHVSPFESPQEFLEQPLFSDGYSITRTVVSALLLPTISTLVGRIFFSNTRTLLQRNILGSLSFILTKGVLKIYMKRQRFLRQLKRHVLNYGEHALIYDDAGTPYEDLSEQEAEPEHE